MRLETQNNGSHPQGFILPRNTGYSSSMKSSGTQTPATFLIHHFWDVAVTLMTKMDARGPSSHLVPDSQAEKARRSVTLPSVKG